MSHDLKSPLAQTIQSTPKQKMQELDYFQRDQVIAPASSHEGQKTSSSLSLGNIINGDRNSGGASSIPSRI